MKKPFGYGCEFCRGIVKGKRVDCEAFKHSRPEAIGSVTGFGPRLPGPSLVP